MPRVVPVSTDMSVPSVRVKIPTAPDFLAQWHLWVHGKVSKHFKRDKERIPDTVQRVRLRLLTKDFISRWFFRHLTDDLVDQTQAMQMLGGTPITYIGKLHPFYTHEEEQKDGSIKRVPDAGKERFGRRSSPDSLWRVSDLLAYANFDYDRYFYSIQGHTIDTTLTMRLLGYGQLSGSKWTVSPQDFGALESLYRQGRIKPAELTEHVCRERWQTITHPDGVCGLPSCSTKHYSRGFCSAHYYLAKVQDCAECNRGRESLLSRGISLADRWSNPDVAAAVSKLRWNDSQLRPFLREWRNANKIKGPPSYIMRTPDTATVDAGLLKYANMIIDNDVINHFKSLSRSDDAVTESGESEEVAWEVSDEDGSRSPVFVDSSTAEADGIECRRDLSAIIRVADLTEDELEVITQADLLESSVREVSEILNLTPAKVNRLRTSALAKMRQVVEDDEALLA